MVTGRRDSNREKAASDGSTNAYVDQKNPLPRLRWCLHVRMNVRMNGVTKRVENCGKPDNFRMSAPTAILGHGDN